MATSNPLLKLFGQSPFKPLQEHMRVVVRCASEVPELFDAMFEDDGDRIETIRDRIFALESEADDIKIELRAHLPKTMFLPVNRRDLLEVLNIQDSIAGTAQDIAGSLMVRRPRVVDSIRDPFMALTDRCLQACNQMERIMEELDELLETGFRGRESEIVLNMIDELNRIETDTDEQAISVLKEV
ncbi:MAG: TIGR00153 family protein, partial [Alphaproteobacteria bacterium]